MAEAHPNGGNVRVIADLFGLGSKASSRYAYSLAHEDLIPRPPDGHDDTALSGSTPDDTAGSTTVQRL